MDTASKCVDSTSEWSDLEWTLRIGSIVLLTVLAALFAGLTLGYMSLDNNGLQIVIDAGDDPDATPEEKKNAAYARKIAPIRKDGHLLLTTMLYGNVGINSIMAIAMADMTNGLVGFFVTTVILVIFGELIPQALCSRHPLSIGGKSVPIIKFFMVIFYVAARPVASILDYCLGHEIGAVYSRTEMSKMLEIHVKQKMLDADETDIMKGAMYFKRKAVASVMTPIDRVYMLPVTTILDLETIKMIYHTGYSRIPVYGKDRNDVVGLIFVKDLIFADPDEKTTLLNFVHVFGRGVHRVWPDSTLGEVMQAFKAGRTHLALVHDVNNDGPGDPFYETKGVVTLEDIVEEILQDKIYDESDEIDPETHRKNRLSHRSYDPGMSHLLEGKQEVKYLARPEAEALAKHLVANDPVFSTVDNNNTPLSESHLASLILTKCPVLEFHTSDAPHADLFVEHKVTNHALVVLHGHVRVTSNSGEVTNAGLWSVHGANALLVPDGSYESDITVEVPSDVYVRCLRISHFDFQATLYPMQIASDASVLQLRRVEIKKSRVHKSSHANDDLEMALPSPAPFRGFATDLPTPTAPYTLTTKDF